MFYCVSTKGRTLLCKILTDQYTPFPGYIVQWSFALVTLSAAEQTSDTATRFAP